MNPFKTAYSTFMEALFPIPTAEREVLAMGTVSAFTSMTRAERSPIPEACSIFSYKDEKAWRLIWSIKYKKSAACAAIAGYALHRILQSYATIVPQIMVVPMPITSRRRRERGFNQCELLADEIERLNNDWNATHCHATDNKDRDWNNNEKGLSIIRDLLVRKRHKSRQTLKDREGRLESAHDIFAVNEEVAQRIKRGAQQSNIGNPQSINRPMIIVIDDVITTGGTIRDAVGTLRAAGFADTWGLSVAH